MADNSVKDAASLLFAIKESATSSGFDFDYDQDAVEWMENMERRMIAELNARGITGLARDRLLLYDGWLKGAIMQIRGRTIKAGQELARTNQMFYDGTPKKEH